MVTRDWIPIAVLGIGVLGTLRVAHASDRTAALTEDQVVAQALERAPLTEAIEGAVEAEDGRGLVATVYPMPQVTYLREQTYGNGGTGEDYLAVAQTIRLGYRGRGRAMVRQARTAAARQAGEAARVEIAAEARDRFYQLLHRQARATELRAWIDRIDEMLAIVTRREARGDAAVYDRRRLERERAVAVARLEVELAAMERAQARLGALLGEGGGDPRVQGTLLPEAAVDPLRALKQKAVRRPDLRALDLWDQAARHELTALSRAWWPDLRLEAGWKGVSANGGGRADGFMANAMLSFQPRNLAIGARQVVQGEARVARGRRALLESELEGELGGARAEAVRLRDGALEFRAQAVTASADLVRIAAVGYDGGELGLLEVLDAYRGSADDALTVLDMEHAARRARIQLERLTGVTRP